MSENYNDKFRRLKPIYNNRRKSPEKAILLLTIIRLHELGQLPDNEIRFNTELKKIFFAVWKEIFDSENLFAPDLYIPFWYMEEETFWHVVPKDGRDEVVELMKDRTVKPSENTIKECVDYVEVDEDLHFLMTMPSGRLQLRKSLLTTYTNHSSEEIEKMCCDKTIQVSRVPDMEEVFKSMQGDNHNDRKILGTDKSAIIGRFFQLDDDVQFVMNIQYFTFLKNNKYVRRDFRELIPDVFVLFDKITCHKIIPGALSSSLAYSYSEFLRELKISLMGEYGADELIEDIEHAIDILEGTEIFEPIKEDVETPIVVTSKISFDLEALPERDIDGFLKYRIVNKGAFGYIYDALGDEVYSTSGGLKEFNDVIYRFNYKSACFTVKRIDETDKGWVKSKKLFVASNLSDLHNALSPHNYINEIEDFVYSNIANEIKIKINGVWYDFAGDKMDTDDNYDHSTLPVKNISSPVNDDAGEIFDNYKPKGKLSQLSEIVQSTYDLLWVMAIVDLELTTNRQANLTLDEISCMMIAKAWELLAGNEELRNKEEELRDCVEFLIEESKEYMDTKLTWDSTKEEVYEAIKDYPMAGVFEDTVESIVASAPINVLKTWFDDVDDEWEIEMRSREFSKSCLYGLYNKKRDPYIMLNPKWQNNLFYEHDDLIKFYTLKLYENSQHF